MEALMIGLVLVTHGRLAEELVSVMEHIVGPQSQIAAVGIAPQDDMEAKRKEILRRVGEVDSGKGVLVLTDMFGGTPSNIAISITKDGKVEALAGVNLPMLIKLASARKTESLSDAALAAQEAGRKHIHAVSALLKQAS
jgi:PTS system mannose-specific IIA component